jgi:hypothetical protein
MQKQWVRLPLNIIEVEIRKVHYYTLQTNNLMF